MSKRYSLRAQWENAQWCAGYEASRIGGLKGLLSGRAREHMLNDKTQGHLYEMAEQGIETEGLSVQVRLSLGDWFETVASVVGLGAPLIFVLGLIHEGMVRLGLAEDYIPEDVPAHYWH